MKQGYIIYVIDCETTGLDPVQNDVIEISMCRLSPQSDGVYAQEQRTWLLKALNPKTISDKALEVNGHSREDILHLTKFGKENYLDPKDVVQQIELWVMDDDVSSLDRVFAGQNPNFDIQALTELWNKVGRNGNFPFSLENGNRVLDTKQIAIYYDICTGNRRRYYNLSSLVKAFKAKKGKAHKASEDVAMTVDLLLKMIEPVKLTIAEKFKDNYLEEDR